MKNKAEISRILSKNHISELDKPEILQNFGQSVARLRTSKGWTQDEMAHILGISKQTYIRIENATTNKVNMICALKIATLFHVPVKELCGYDLQEMDLYNALIQATPRTRRLLKSILLIDAEEQKQMSQKVPDGECMIDCLSCANDLMDGVPASRFYHKMINVSEYRTNAWYSDADVIIEVNSNAYHPLYHMGDRLVISCRAPVDGDVGVFLRDSTFYLRKYVAADRYCYLDLLTVQRSDSNPFFVVGKKDQEEMSKWVKFGVVIAVI